eukprot:m.150610 g.150610  ORF g.150610 m.150610 type:complete len:374 (-) comp30735_c0_seq1:240-1361(-)
MAFSSMLVLVGLSLVHVCFSSGTGEDPLQLLPVINIANGYLMQSDGTRGKFVGLTTTALQGVVDTMFLPGPLINTSAWVNSSALRYLVLEGAYVADVPLQLPSYFVLQLGTTTSISAKQGLEGAVILMNTSKLVAVKGGSVDCTMAADSKSLVGIWGQNAQSLIVRGVRIQDCGIGGTANIYIHGLPFAYKAEVSFSEVSGSKNRGIWVETFGHAQIHDNHCHHNVADGIDFDAYTANGVAYNNLCESNSRHGLFIEEAANGCSAFNNTMRNNSGGIVLYGNVVGPVANNLIVMNTLEANDVGISFGTKYGTKVTDQSIFASNTFRQNKLDVARNGDLTGMWLLDNHFGSPIATAIAQNVINAPISDVLLFDP